MAVAQAQEPQKSSPDRTRLAAMTSRTVQVTRLMTKTGPGQTIISAEKNASMDWIDQLPQVLASTWGAGTYKIEVFDEAGPEKDVWTAKLGPVVPEQQENQMSGNGFSALPAGAIEVSPGLVSLGHGFYYNEALGLLTTPTKQVIPWRPGENFPTGLGPIPSAQAGASAPWTPWGPQGQQGGAQGMPPWGWGGYPTATPVEDTAAKRELEGLKASLLAAEKRAEDAERRRQQDETNARIDKLIEAGNARTEALMSELRKMRELPTGPNPEIEALKAQLVETQRRSEDLQRQQAQQLEQQRAEERYKTQIQDMNAKFEATIRELSGNRTDPMIAVLTQLMNAQAASASETVRAISESTRAQLEAARSQLATSSLTPEKMMDMIRTLSQSAAGANGEINKGLTGMFSQLFEMSKDMINLKREGDSAGQPSMLEAMASQALGQVGQLAKVWAASKMVAARPPGAAPAGGPQQPQQQQPQQRLARPAPVAIVAPPPTDSVAFREEAAGAIFGPRGADGRPIGRQPAPAPVAAPEVAAAPAPVPAAAAPAPMAPAPAPAAAASPEAGGRRGGKRRREAAPAGVAGAPAPASAPAAGGTVIPIHQMPASDLRTLVARMPDEQLFGEALSQIVVLRASVREANLPPKEVAEAVLMSRQYFQAFNILPPCLELLSNGHFDILCDRLLPESSEAFRAQCVQAIGTQLAAELAAAQGGGGEEEGGDDEDDAGEEGADATDATS